MAIISGSSSVDVLTGTSGSDTFSGFAGHDTFVFDARGTAQTDVIVDFGATYFGGVVTGNQEVPAVSSSASGFHSGWLNRGQTEFFFGASVAGLDLGGQTVATTDNVTAAHFHRAAAGTSGGVVFGFIGAPNNETGGETAVNPAAGSVTGSWDAGEGNGVNTLTSLLPALLNSELYINFHTSVNPSGEIRGQTLRLDSGLDLIDVSQSGIGDFTTLQQLMTESGGATSITMNWNGQASVLVLSGVPIARLSASDFVFGSTEGRSWFGTAGNDDVFGGGGSDFLAGEGGSDRLFAGAGADFIEGRDGNDSAQGGDGDDRVSGGQGDDDVNGNAGADHVLGDEGNDTVRGGQGDDTVSGGAGSDAHVNGNLGADVVHGDDGDDTVYGGQGADTVYGDAGADLISGDLGADILYGGSGGDRFAYRTGSGNDWVGDFNFADGDRIQLATGTTYAATSHQGQAMITLASGESLGLAGVAASSFSSSWVVFV